MRYITADTCDVLNMLVLWPHRQVRVVNEHATPNQKPGMALDLVIGKLEVTWEDHAREFSQQASAKSIPGVCEGSACMLAPYTSGSLLAGSSHC
jgi:hypothetical protein